MVAIIGISFFIFFFYFLSSFNNLKTEHRFVFICLFVFSVFVLRIVISPELNKDYDAYFGFHDSQMPQNIISFILGEPYLAIVYAFFDLFTDDKVVIFSGIYWFNLFFVTAFFVWILTRNDIQMWKKNILFSSFYFLFAFVLIRNSGAYIMVALYFYYTYRNIKFNSVLISPLIHLSSLPMLITYFHKQKNYYIYLISFIVFAAVAFIFLFPIISSSPGIDRMLSKVSTYSAETETVSVFHKVYFLFVSFILIITALVYKKKMLHPFIITTMALYYIGFMINPVIGFRFVPYLLFSIFFFNYNGIYNSQQTRILNITSFFLFPYFLYTLIDTHNL
jgi:hypothetical protein|tara:strand:- start:2480 stop:3484 length:1005 start_codon:yes stop_codon:yes gene_type:complete